jgi:chromosome partitioning protein
VETPFRLVIMDTPAGLGMVTRGAMATADWVLVPFQAETLAVRSMAQLLQLVEHARAHENPRLKMLGAVPTMVEKGSVTSQNVLLEMWRGYPDILETVIPRAEVFAQASAKGLPISYLGGPRAPEAARFSALAQEVENLMTKHTPNEVPHGQSGDRQLF